MLYHRDTPLQSFFLSDQEVVISRKSKRVRKLNAVSHVSLISGLCSQLKLRRFLSLNSWHLFAYTAYLHCSTVVLVHNHLPRRHIQIATTRDPLLDGLIIHSSSKPKNLLTQAVTSHVWLDSGRGMCGSEFPWRPSTLTKIIASPNRDERRDDDEFVSFVSMGKGPWSVTHLQVRRISSSACG